MAPNERDGPDAAAAVELARACFLDERHEYGCAETVFVTLKAAYGLRDSMDSAAALALNGGIAYGGGPCGAVTGAALAVGLLAGERIDDHGGAKRVAREIVADLVEAFRLEHGALDCRALIGYDLRAPGGHDAFLASDVWRDACMRQIEFVVRRLAPLADAATWQRAVAAIEAGPSS
jgi:C_GCAxxG_C_C family probable redox protein